MGRFLLRRLLFAALLVAAVSSSALVLTRLAPGDVTTDLGAGARPEERQRLKARFDLDRGIAGQWAVGVGRAGGFDCGESYLYNQPVRGLVAQAAVNTAILALSALVVATLCGVGLGVVTGWP